MKIGRNSPCPCGFGRKWKKCCGALEDWQMTPSPLPSDHFMVSWCCASEVIGQRVPWEEVIATVSEWNVEFTFSKLARMAACIQNAQQPTEALVGWSRRDLEALRDSGIATGSNVARTLIFRWDRSGRGRVVASEKGILLAEAIVLAHGAADGREPTHEEVTWLLLRVNDHATALGGEKLSTNAMLAELAHALRFNRHPDFLRDVARADLVLATPPSTRPDLQGDAWEAFLKSAFAGVSFATYVDHFLGPLTLQSSSWMASIDSPEAPIIDPAKWGTELQLGAQFCAARLNELAVQGQVARQDATEAVRGDAKRLPSFMFRTPLVEIRGRLIATSPSLVRGQLHTGIWGRCLDAARRADWGSEPDAWHKVFGTLFDQYAEWVSKQAEQLPAFKKAGYQLVGRSGVGADDEIEDVVLVQGDNVLLASCKAGLMPELAVRQNANSKELVKWLERVFFKEVKDEEHRQGAMFLLNRRVAALRAGKFEPRVARTARVFPVFVTYDHLGENSVFLRWLATEATKRQLLGQPEVMPPVVIDVAVFEALMSFAAHGHDVWSVLASVAAGNAAGGSVDRKLREVAPRPEVLRLPALKDRFDAVVARVKANFRPATTSPR